MAATTCAYDFDSAFRPPSRLMGSVDDGDDDARGHHRCPIIHGVAPPPPPPAPPPPPPPPPLPPPLRRHHHPGLCTEGLGSESSESSGDLDLADIVADDDIQDCKRQQQDDQELGTLMPARRRVFPPPISVIGAAGKPWQYLRAQRGGGRLVLREVRIPSRELLHACREDGRLKLHFAHPEQDDDQECNN